MRTYDYEALQEVTKRYQFNNWSAEEWLDDEKNIALEEEGDYSLFQYQSPGVYIGHFFYTKSRGRQAINRSKQFLKEIFNDYSEVKVILGLTPLEHLGARWLSKRIGFKSFGTVETEAGECEMFILTRKDYETRESEGN